MDLCADLFIAVLVAAAGVPLGRLFAKLRNPYWMLGYFIPLGLLLLFVLAVRLPALSVVPPVSWMVLGRNKFAACGFIATLLLTTPLLRLRRKPSRVLLGVLMVVVVFATSVFPFLPPMFDRAELLGLKTQIDTNGICLQSTDYTCGAAAAVTGLRKLGFPAEEGEIAVLARTSLIDGTEPDILAEQLRRHYGKDGLIAEYKVFKNIDELKNAGLTLAVTKHSLLEDHFVAVLEVTSDSVILGDPVGGRVTPTREEFLKKWRFTGVVLRRRK